MLKDNFIQFDFFNADKEQYEVLIARLAEIGFEGFEEIGNYLLAFIREIEFDEGKFSSFLDLFENISYHRALVQYTNWNQEWEGSFMPVVIGDFAAIRADFHPPVIGVRYEMIITPKMSFGTGHHATTFLMIDRMQGMDLSNKEVFDFGSGTGVLAILAEKMGAEKVTAMDNDECSIENMKENFLSNNCTKIKILQDNKVSGSDCFDIIMANINLNVVMANLSAIHQAARENCIVLLSGFLLSDEEMIMSALLESSFSVTSTAQKGEWICLQVAVL